MTRPLKLAMAAIAVALWLSAAGCGGSSESSGNGSGGTLPASQDRQQATSTESQQGGAGDEEPGRSEIALSVGTGVLKPRSLAVAAYLPVRIVVRSVDGRPHTVSVDTGERSVQVHVANSPAVLNIPGLKPGSYRIVGDSDARATLAATSTPGP